MKGWAHRRKILERRLIGLAAAVAWTALLAPPTFAGGQPALAEQAQVECTNSGPRQPGQEPAASDMIIHVDPQTGLIVNAPAPGAVPLPLPPDVVNALSSSHQGLVEVSSPLPGGGVQIDLQGRFRSPVFATIDSTGKPRLLHLGERQESEGHE